MSLLFALVPLAFADPPAPPLWFSGCWEDTEEAAGGRYREVWLGPDRGVLVGASLSPGPDGTIGWEHLWVGAIDGKLAYVATPSGQERTVFPAIAVDADRAVFELPEHDFPQRITYTRTAAGIGVRVEARVGEGWEGFGFTLRPCQPAPRRAAHRRR